MLNWLIGARTQTVKAAASIASAELLASIDLFTYIRGLQRRHAEELIGGTPVGRVAAVALSRCLIEHAWLQLAPGTMPSPPQLRQSLNDSWAIFAAPTVANLDMTYREVASRRISSDLRLALVQLEHWSEAAVARRFADHRPVRGGWLTYVFGVATDNSEMTSTALNDFPVMQA